MQSELQKLPRDLRKRIRALCAQWGFRQCCVVRDKQGFPSADPLDVVIVPFVLHTMEEGACSSFLHAAKTAASHLIILEYRQPERNLDFPAYWLSCLLENGGTHKAQYRAFMQRGGIEMALREAELLPLHREAVRCGAASLVVCLGKVAKR